MPCTEAYKEHFLLELERRVSADSVVSIGNVEYEVDMRFARQRIRLRCSPDMEEVYVAQPDGTLLPVRLLNKQEEKKNCHFYKAMQNTPAQLICMGYFRSSTVQNCSLIM